MEQIILTPEQREKYNEFIGKSYFNKFQKFIIKLGIFKGLDVSWYANPEFEDLQMLNIFKGLKRGLDVSYYADPKFTWKQMEEILEGLEKGIDVSL